MSGFRIFLTLCCWSLTTELVLAADAIELPTDPKVGVVELWFASAGQEPQSEIAVFANGRIWCRVGEGSIWGQFDPQDLQKLVRSLLETDGLATITTQSIQESIQRESHRSGLTGHIADADDTIIVIRTAAATYRLDGHAVGLLATRFPEAEALQQFAAAQRRLENVRAIVMVGGPQAADNLARMACNRLQAEYGESIPVTPADLSMVRSLADGTRFCQFVVRQPHAPAAESRIVSLFECPGEAPRVSVLPDGPQLR